MSEIDWDEAPEGAVAVKQDNCGYDYSIHWVNSRDEWWDSEASAWVPAIGKWKQTIATRPQPRKTVEDAVEKNEQEWTHTSKGHRCKIDNNAADKRGYITIIREDIGYCVADPADLKPITRKPTISEDAKRQLELYVQYRIDKYGDYTMKADLSDYLSHHDII